ncbi:MAG TPA: efflux RND transporter permease subunit [Methylovirgula sp.]
MAFNVSAWSIRRPLPAIVFAVAILALGIASFRKLPITLLPNVDPPIVTVVVTQLGTPPSDVEAKVTQPIENAVAHVEGVKHIMSSISDGVSATTIAFNLDVNPVHALAAVKAAVATIRNTLPDTIAEPKIRQVDAIGLGILTYAAISNSKTPEQLSYFVDTVVLRKLKGVSGVSAVDRIGGVEREFLVSLNPARLQAHGISAAQVSHSLSGTNAAVADASAEDKNDSSIRTLPNAKSVAQLASMMISLPKGGTVRLGDLGTVTDTIVAPRRFARLDGKPIVGFSILRAKGASDVAVARKVRNAVETITAAHPDVGIKLIDTSVHYTEGNYDSALHTLFEGAALAVIVVFLFLRDIRATVIAAVALPLSIIPAFWVMDMLGFSLNLVSLLAITLATGILVDDAIVEIENIVRHMRMGKSAYQAAHDAAAEIGLAVIAISLTIVAVFAPVSFIGNIAGQYFKQFGLTVAAEVMFSLIAARMITPMLAAYFLKPHPHEVREGRLTQRYGKIVEWSVVHRYKTVCIGLVLFAASILSITTNLVSRDFEPTQDSGRSHLAIELPAGASLDATRKLTDRVTRRLKKRPEVKSVFIDGGRIAPGMPAVRDAQLTVNYVPKSDRTLSVHQLQALINTDLDKIPDITHWFVDDYGTRPVARIFTGPDSETVTKFAAAVAAQMKQIPLIDNIVASTTVDQPELHIQRDGAAAAKLGVSKDSLAETISIATIGDNGSAVANVNNGQRLVPVRVALDQTARGNLPVLDGLAVPTDTGATVPLGKLAKLQFGEGPISLKRFDRESSATVEAALVGHAALSDVEAAINKLPIMQHLPPGVKIQKSAVTEAMDDLSSGFAEAMRNGLILVYVVLVLLFASFLQPVTILFSLPLSIGGAVLALLVAGRPLSMPVIIGILMLMGIVTKNAIMIVDFSNRAMASGMARTKAIVEAGKKRARPIIMTTIAMIAGMVPSALGLGAGGEFRSPMAIAVIGGLLVSTLLSLLFVPAVFAVMDDVRLGILRGWNAVTLAVRSRVSRKAMSGIDLMNDPDSIRGPAE